MESPLLLDSLAVVALVLLLAVTGGVGYLTVAGWRDRRREDQEKRETRRTTPAKKSRKDQEKDEARRTTPAKKSREDQEKREARRTTPPTKKKR